MYNPHRPFNGVPVLEVLVAISVSGIYVTTASRRSLTWCGWYG